MAGKKGRLGELLSQGKVFEAYGKEYMLSVSVVPGIEKVLVSLIKLGSKGKDHVDIYVDFAHAKRFKDLLKAGVVRRAVEADTNANPTLYKYVTGKDGCKSVALGKANKPGTFLVQLQDNTAKARGGNVYTKMPVIFEEAESVGVLAWEIAMGEAPVATNPLYKKLQREFWEAVERVSQYHREDEADEPYEGEAPEAPEEFQQAPAAPAPASPAPQQAPAPAPAATQQAAQAQQAAQQQAPEQIAAVVNLLVLTNQAATSTGRPCVKAQLPDGREVGCLWDMDLTPTHDIVSGAQVQARVTWLNQTTLQVVDWV